ncbi:MAG: hypothetical protein HRT58_14245 [Crocinitomicaceae bacterium]|nr:hypothetical protein [Flavobacteriales bacterium]NQZ36826.1 hypothetical protein [Crocinitomicaceae bacterium]
MCAINPYVHLTTKNGKYYLQVMLPISPSEENVKVEEVTVEVNLKENQIKYSEGIGCIVILRTEQTYSADNYVLLNDIEINPSEQIASSKIQIEVNPNEDGVFTNPETGGKTIIQFEDAVKVD